MTTPPLRHALLDALGVEHGFGLRDTPAPAGLCRPRQVHGKTVALLERGREDSVALEDADAVVSDLAGVSVGVVTADCVPVLVAAEGSGSVAAVHAGWRGLVAGIIPEALRVLRERAPGARLRAAIGPHIGPCCYEVDAPVLDALRLPYAGALDEAVCSTREGHALLDLGRLATASLCAAGIEADAVGRFEATCTRCDALRFHSFRRDGQDSGRLVHWIAAAGRAPQSP